MTAVHSNSALTELRGVGDKLSERLSKLHLNQVRDLLFHLPLRFEDRTRITPIGDLRMGVSAQVVAEIVSADIKFGRKRMLVAHVEDESGILALKWFHFYPSQKKVLVPGRRVLLFGESRWSTQGPEMIHPEFTVLKPSADVVVDDVLTPIYPTTQGVGQATLRGLIKQALTCISSTPLDDALDELCRPLKLPQINAALHLMHSPAPDQSVGEIAKSPARIRLAIEELIAQQVGLRLYRQQTKRYMATPLAADPQKLSTFIQQLKFELTSAQQRVIGEIAEDLSADQPMMRLVQGDVGAGKTVVAAAAVLSTVSNQKQACLMAPTEILAEQHYQSFSNWFTPMGVKVALLIGKTKASERKTILAALAAGEIDFIVGTHALFQKDVVYKKLALVVIDEQHRFGVEQRKALIEKGQKGDVKPHQLVMTATPIPRTLAMTFYADLDVSAIDELPPGRTPIQTIAISNNRRAEIIDRIRSVCQSGQQVYWVCTLIEESDVLDSQPAELAAELLTSALPELKVGLVHGKMKAKEKDAQMHAFKTHEVDVLVATTVIEVGVDVPNATLMVIENAERLGLAQLHQLRGRVGRGSLKSFCVLLYDSPLSPEGKERLNVMRETTNGFVIAEKDLELRGAGEVIGTRQTGDVQFRIADLSSDAWMVPHAREFADELIQRFPNHVDKLVCRWLNDGQKNAEV